MALGAIKAEKAATSGVVAAKELPLLRKQYVNAIGALAGKIPEMRQAGMSTEQIARTLHAERNALKSEFRALSPAEKVVEFEQRNIQRYGNPLGPTIEELRNAGKSWDDIIESAMRAGGSDLGY
jgi:hypothetical protein